MSNISSKNRENTHFRKCALSELRNTPVLKTNALAVLNAGIAGGGGQRDDPKCPSLVLRPWPDAVFWRSVPRQDWWYVYRY